MSSIIKLYPNGLTAGVPPRGGPKSRGDRKALQGWSAESIRSNQRFLFSVNGGDLTGTAYSVTLTVANCPESADEWKRLRGVFFDRLRRRCLLYGHWLTDPGARWIVDAWLEAAAQYRPMAQSQHVTPLYDALGWFQYVSKHAARGLAHYQRSPELIPPGWQGRTGRMWGTLGNWPRSEAMALNLSMPAFHAFRRLLRRRRIADARAAGSPSRIAHARGMLRCNDPKRSSVRGASDWCDLSESLGLIAAVGALGHQIYS